MSNFKQLYIQLLLFLSLITCITSQIEWIDYEPSTYSASYTHTKGSLEKVVVAVDFKNNLVPYYIRVTATPKEGSTTPILCFSPTSNTCSENRIVLTRNGDNNPAILFVKREEFEDNEKELYIYATCQNSDCEYDLKFEGAQSAEINENSIFSYVVTNVNKGMVYEVVGNATEGDFLTIGVEGSPSLEINIEDLEKQPLYLDNGRIITFPIIVTNSNILAKFTIKGANIGDYLTLNIHVVKSGTAPDNLLYPNGPVVMGMLDKSEGYFIEECFPISALASEKYSNVNKYYLTGRIHSKYALFWLADENNMYMEETEIEIADGQLSFLIENNGKKRSVCFEFSYDPDVRMEYVAYSISILEPTKLESLYNFYPPQTIGEIYRRMIPKGSIAVYHGAKIGTSDKRLTFNMYSRKGAAEMYVTECTDFPNCIYKVENLGSMTRPKKINKMTIWEKTIDKEVDSLSRSKYVMVVYCRDDDNEQRGYCEVETNVNILGKDISLVENEKFSKYVVKGDKGKFKVDFKLGKRLQRLSLDIMIYSGDVNFKVNNFEDNNGKLSEEIDINYFKYYLSNKIHYHFNFAQLIYDCLLIEYYAEKNSFFTIQYEYDGHNPNQIEENITSGESYLVQIDPTINEKYKIIYLYNYRYKKEQPFLANFFSLNCEFQVLRGEKEITFFDGYAEEILTKDTQGYKSERYVYNITIKEADVSNYNHKMCMLYVAGYESQDKESSSEIVVGENVNQQVIFTKDFKNIRFLYPLADPQKDLAVYINIIDQAIYNINIYLNNVNTPIQNFKITRSQIYHIATSDISNYCEKDTLCAVIVDATFERSLDNLDITEDPMIEITIRQIENEPSYLQKSQAKRDFTCGDNFYYLYTDIGKNEIGEISVNFLRDFGNVWAKIVRKDQTQKDEESNWRGIYRMPSEDWEDSYLHNLYTKKIQFGVEHTQDCIEGCYLLLSIRISQIGEYVENYKFYPFSIITRITPNNYAYTDIPKVHIQVDEYIIGNVDVSENERIFQFYEVWLPHDSYRVEFDFQSSVAGLYINIGNVRPTTKNADFKLLPQGRDSLLYLDKYNILKKAEDKKFKIPYKDSLQDINLVIGIWTDKTDSIDTEIFSLTVREPNKNTIDIIEVNTDQKILCSPSYLNDNQYQCLFMIIYDDEDVKLEMPLIVHAASVNQTATTHTHASFIERQYYDEYDYFTLRKSIPTFETATYSTQRDDVDYIYSKLKPFDPKEEKKHHYLFVNVISNKQDDIFLLTSMPMYNFKGENNIEFYPNPSTEQLLFLSVDSLNLKFFTSSSIVNIVTLGGEAEVIWADKPQNIYNLRGRGDRLTLTSGTQIDELVIKKRASSSNKLNDVEHPGFVFYISYYARDASINFDEILYGKSLEMSYRDTDLPVYIYSKIGNIVNDIIVAVTFKDSEMDTSGEISMSPIDVTASIAKENSVYKAKKNPELTPSLENSLPGLYDPAIKTAIVFLSNSFSRFFNIKPEDNPTIYLSLQKNIFVPKDYKNFNVEAQITKINSGVVPVEKTYNYGVYVNHYTNFYKLKVDKNKNYMLIELAFNSKSLNFALSEAITQTNMTKMIKSATKARGKILLLIDTKSVNSDLITLNIFKTSNSPIVNYNLNYVFKYLNVEKEDDYIDYKILEDNNDLYINEKSDSNTATTTITCTFNKLEISYDKANITYFFKIVDNLTHYYEEEYETIAFMESPYYAVYERNPKDSNGKITLTAHGPTSTLANWVYLQVIAQIQQDTILEYVAYKGVKNLRPPIDKPENTSSSGISTTAFVVFAIIILVIIAALIVVVFIIQQKNKSLLNQVKHVSFQQNVGTPNTDPDLLLQKN